MSNVTITQSDVQIYTPDGTALMLSPTLVTTSGAGTEGTPPLPVTGTYTIVVDPRSTYTGTLTLTLSEDLTGAIVVDGPPVRVTIPRPGQKAWVTFSGTAGQLVSLATSGTMSSDVAIYGPNGQTIAGPLTLPNVDSTNRYIDVRTLPEAGQYTVLVNPRNANTGSLTLTLQHGDPDIFGPITIGGPSVVVTFATPGQDTFLTFSGTAGSVLASS